MSKVTLNNITSGYGSSAALNTNFDLIEAAFDNTLSLDGSTPNQLQTNLDMNGYAILNQRATSGNENFIWRGTWITGEEYSVNNLVYAPEGTNEGATLICVTANTAGATLDGDSAKWAVFAQRGASGAGTGDVVGPASSTTNSLARFSDTTGKLLKDGAVIGTDVMAYDAGLAATTAFAKTVLDDADAATARATLGTDDAANITTGNLSSDRIANALNATGTAPIYACRAWVAFNGISGVAYASGNASVTKNATGDYTITFTTALPDINYAVFGSISTNYGVRGGGEVSLHTTAAWVEVAPTTSSFRVVTTDGSGAVFNPKYVTISVFR